MFEHSFLRNGIFKGDIFPKQLLETAPVLPLLPKGVAVHIIDGDYKGLSGHVNEVHLGDEIEAETDPASLAELVIDLEEVPDMAKNYPHLNGTSVSDLLFCADDHDVAYEISNGFFVDCTGHYMYGKQLTTITPADIDKFNETFEVRTHSLGFEKYSFWMKDEHFTQGAALVESYDEPDVYGNLHEVTMSLRNQEQTFDLFIPFRKGEVSDLVMLLIAAFKEANFNLYRYAELLHLRHFLFHKEMDILTDGIEPL